MFDDFRERRNMKRRIRKLNKFLYATGFNLDRMEELTKIRKELQPLEERFDMLETMRLQSKAERLGIEIPSDREGWWYTNKSYVGLNLKALSKKGQTGARKIIRDENLRTNKAWVEMLIPILSMIVAILALIRR